MISKKIKESTANSHRAVEQSLVMRPLSEPTLTLDQYALILRKFHGYFVPLEEQLDEVEGISVVLPDYGQRRKGRWLERDLLALPPAVATSPLPRCQQLPQVKTQAQALGCLYVLEGSTLGGRLISRHVQEKLGIGLNSGGSFFQGYGPDTGSRWKAFQEALTTYHQQHGREEEIIEAATDTFHKLEQWLNQP